jgi:hypothetical protein
MSRAQQGHTYSSVQARTRVLLDDEMMREILVDVGGMRTALELELWASWILGQTWKQRVRQPQFAEVDWMLTVGAPMIAMIAEIGGARARKALTAISMLERGSLGNYAGSIALTLPGARTPAWMADIAGARFVNARQSMCFADSEVILFDLERRGRHELTVAVSVDHSEGGIARWIELVGPVPPQLRLAGEAEEDAEPLEELELTEAACRAREAIEASDRDPRARVDPIFADLRAFLLARLIDAGPGA